MDNVKPQPRPKVLYGMTLKYSLGCGNIYITVNHDSEGRPIEVFGSIGKSGVCSNMFSDSLTRALSLSLRAGVSVDKLIKQLEFAACGQGAWSDGVFVNSCSDAIAKALRRAKEEGAQKVAVKEELSEEELHDEEEEAALQVLKAAEERQRIEEGGQCLACQKHFEEE